MTTTGSHSPSGDGRYQSKTLEDRHREHENQSADSRGRARASGTTSSTR